MFYPAQKYACLSRTRLVVYESGQHQQATVASQQAVSGMFRSSGPPSLIRSTYGFSDKYKAVTTNCIFNLARLAAPTPTAYRPLDRAVSFR